MYWNSRSAYEAYLETMRRRSDDALSQLLSGIRQLVYTDMPDHDNIGDSAIALGFFRYARRTGLALSRVYSMGTLPPAAGELLLTDAPAVAIHGGGNFGGLYPHFEDHRYALVRGLPAGTPLVQLPQSVVFANAARREAFFEEFAVRPDARLGIRDHESAARVEGASFVLAPDSVHQLGAIDGPAADIPYVVLARTDRESAAAAAGATIDWPGETRLERLGHRLRLPHERAGVRMPAWNPSPRGWERIARRRVERGAVALARGETIVTDRLHAMLIGLQLGRRVVAVENANGKLGAYAKTWFGELEVPLRFASSFAEALELARAPKGAEGVIRG